MNYGDKQFMMFLARANAWAAIMTSGAYKLRKIHHGFNGPELTDEEKLADACSIMNQHLSNAQNNLDYVPEEI
jgi:hypothetical protein